MVQVVYTQATQAHQIKVEAEAVESPALEEIHQVRVQKVVKVLMEAQQKFLDHQSHMAVVVVQTMAVLLVAQAALAAVDEQIRAARVAFRGVREEAALGARTTLDVLNAEQELLDAQANRITAASNEYKAYYGLLSAMGLLTVENLKLNVPQYDPTAYYNMVKDAPSAVSEQGRKLDRVLQKLGKQ